MNREIFRMRLSDDSLLLAEKEIVGHRYHVMLMGGNAGYPGESHRGLKKDEALEICADYVRDDVCEVTA